MIPNLNTDHLIERASVPELDRILGAKIPVLDHGFVRLIDYMGNDAAVVQMARVSYGAGTKTLSDDEALSRLLLRQRHTSPFEGCEIKFHFKMPMFIGEQTLRHRTANVNKESGRYSVMSDDKYVPTIDRIAKQSVVNKQGSGAEFPAMEALRLIGQIEVIHQDIQARYNEFVSNEVDLARELARGILPANQYAEFYWKIDLHNLMNFLKLRRDHHAQYEIRVYADAIWEFVKVWLPYVSRSAEDYIFQAVTFSRMEMEVIREYIQDYFEGGEYSNPVKALLDQGCTKREAREFVAKIMGE